MNIFHLIIAVFIATLHMQTASAYEIQTHGNLSKAAYDQSGLNKDPQLFLNLGLKSSNKFPNSQDPELRTIKELIADGANFEDNVTLTNLRPINHFFDPISGDALLPLIAKPSPSWALEDRGQINGFIGIFGVQKYSFADARGYLFKALSSPLEADRNKNFGLTFQTLGHVIHHVQDMAQPQHVRLDSHLRLSDSDRADWLFENGSRYEKYTKDNPDKLTPLFGLYPPVNAATDTRLATARAFWQTGQGGGMGLAEFTNRNFVSAGTNFDTNRYPSPGLADAVPHDVDANILLQSAGITPPPECPPTPVGEPLKCVMTFYRTAVNDIYRPGASGVNDRASTESIFDQDLKVKNLLPAFSLNRFNFDAVHQFLIPRAVGYSAGLIDYFFRGKIDLVLDPANAGKHIIKNLGTEDMTGTFTLYYDAVDGNRYPVAGDTPSETWTSRTITANGQLDNLSFTPPANPAPKTPGEYMLVFRGALGLETDAVAAKLILCTRVTDPATYPPPAFTGNSSYESLPVAWLTREVDGTLQLNGYIWIKKHPIPPPVLRCFPLPAPPYCAWYLYYPPSPYSNNYDAQGDRYTPALTSGNEFVKAWIDLNGDGAYTNDELVYEGQYSPLLVGTTWNSNQLITLKVPLTLTSQGYCKTMMRVAMQWGAPPSGPYADWAYGSSGDFYIDLR